MNSIIIRFILEFIIFIGACITAFIQYKSEKPKHKITFYVALIVAFSAFLCVFLIDNVPVPHIDRAADYSTINISAGEPMKIEYRISTNGENSDKWIEYKKPFKVEKNAIVYARARTLWYTSDQTFRDVYVAENGLVYFSGADEPGDTIVSIDADYCYTDALDGEAGNHYIGYEIEKSDIEVTGTDLNGNKKKISDFSYSPKIIDAGTNNIEVEYSIASDISVTSNIKVNGDEPSLIQLEAEYIGGNVYLDTVLDKENFVVQGIYEDGTKSALTDYSISSDKLKEGSNKITISSGRLSNVVELTAINRETITESEKEPNNDIQSANEIEANIKYSGVLKNEEDVDYYRLQLDQKGKLSIKLSHPKMDTGDVFWITSLLSQEENAIVEMNSTGQDAETQSSFARVSPGIYYIRIAPRYCSDKKYTFTVLFEEEDESYEIEPNDDLSSQAMEISLNTEYTGNLTTENDTDYFKFRTDSKQKVWIKFSHSKTNTNDTLWKAALFDDSDAALLNIDSSGANASLTSDCVRLPAGDYYVRVNAYYWSNLDYTFSVCSEEEDSSTEDEPNNDYAAATPISLGSSITGNIQSENDVDFYQFTLENTGSIQVTFSHQKIDDNATFWRYELYNVDSSEAFQNTEEQSTISITGNSVENIVSKWESLPAGTYYLKVYGYYYNNNDYQISVSN